MTKDQTMIHTLAQENEDLKAEIGRLRQLIHSNDEQVRILNCEDIDIQKFTEIMKHQRLQVIQPSKDCVSLEVYKQVIWERDIAIEQLKELGYEFGEKIRTSEDCVSRAEVLNLVRFNAFHVKSQIKAIENMPLVTPTQSWIPLVWDEYPTVDSDGNDDYVYAVDYSVPMPKEDEWVLITDENHNVRVVQYDGYDFGDYVREEILAWKHLPNPYIE